MNGSRLAASAEMLFLDLPFAERAGRIADLDFDCCVRPGSR